jgi:EmrB/QacA subfamily drug resistance transporter
MVSWQETPTARGIDRKRSGTTKGSAVMTALHIQEARAPSSVPSDRRHLMLTVGLAVLGVFVTYVPITAVSVALATIGRATRASTSDLQWVSDAYVIPMAAAVLSAGLFGDLHGRRRMFLGGMALTLSGAAVAGSSAAFHDSVGIHMLWAGQAISGLGAGLLLPTTLALIAHVVPNPRDRGKYIGIWATGLLLGLAAGPLLSGVILDHASYGWTVLPTVALAAIAGAAALARLPESKATENRRLDWLGQITATIAIAASIYGVIEGGNQGWSAPVTIAGLCVGAAAFAAFIAAELRSDSPLLNLTLFKSAAFTAAGFSALIALFSVVGVTFLLSLFLGYVQHLSALDIGWRLLFITGVAAVINPVIGWFMHKVKVIYLLTAGLAVSAVAVLLLTGIGAQTSLADLGWHLAIFGLSIAIMLTTVSVAAINAVPWKLAGMAAAANTAMRQYGSALGPAILGVIFVDRTNSGASPASALHTALAVNGILIAAAALACLLTARVSKHNPTDGS